MAENKKSFILYSDFKEVFNELSDQDAGQLIKHIFQYVNDENPTTENPIVKISFIPIKNQLKRDLKDWEEIRQERSKAGKIGGLKSGESRQSKQTKQVLQTVSKTKQTQANEAVTANVTVNEREAPLIEYRIEECLTVAMNDERWVKANQVTDKDLKEFNMLLERRGHYRKNPADYKSHFANWKTTGKKETYFDKKESSSPPLKTLEELNGN